MFTSLEQNFKLNKMEAKETNHICRGLIRRFWVFTHKMWRHFDTQNVSAFLNLDTGLAVPNRL